jgi:hypothetical protein
MILYMYETEIIFIMSFYFANKLRNELQILIKLSHTQRLYRRLMLQCGQLIN